jgi:hypothetical protein
MTKMKQINIQVQNRRVLLTLIGIMLVTVLVTVITVLLRN